MNIHGCIYSWMHEEEFTGFVSAPVQEIFTLRGVSVEDGTS